MVIKEKKTYICQLNEKDVESLSDTINLLYQFKNNPEAWQDLQECSSSHTLRDTSLVDLIGALTEIGGEAYQRYIRKVHISAVSGKITPEVASN